MEEYVRSKVTIKTVGNIKYTTRRVNGDIIVTLLPGDTPSNVPDKDVSLLKENTSLDFYVSQRREPISTVDPPILTPPDDTTLPEEPEEEPEEEEGEGEEPVDPGEVEPELPEEPQEPEPEPEPIPVPTVPVEPEEPEIPEEPEEPEEEIEIPEFLENGTANPAYKHKQEVEEDGIREGQQTEEDIPEQ